MYDGRGSRDLKTSLILNVNPFVTGNRCELHAATSYGLLAKRLAYDQSVLRIFPWLHLHDFILIMPILKVKHVTEDSVSQHLVDE